MRDDTLFVRSITEFTLNPYDAGENQSGLKEVKYQINGGNPVLYTEKFTIPGNGVKNLSIDASDNVNNTSNKKQTLFMDNDPPEIKPSFSVDQIGSKKVRDESFIIYPKEVKVYLAATDKHVGTETIFYSVGGGEEKTYTRPIQYFRQGSNVTIDIRALDILGNESKKTLTFSVE